MEDLTKLVDVPAQAPAEVNPSVSDEQLLQMINEAGKQEASQAVSIPELDKPSPVAPISDGQVVAPVEAQPVSETKPVEQKQGVTFEQLQEKQGFKSVDDLAKSYSELMKKMHQQANELSKIRQVQPSVQPQNMNQYQPPVQEQVAIDPNRQFLEQFANDPIGTLATAQRIMLKDVIETQKQIELRNELTRLSSSPKTADFNLPEVQNEIQRIIQERPNKYIDNTGRLELEDLYYMAKGRLAQLPASQGMPAQQINRPMPVEGVNKPVAAQAMDIGKLSDDQLKQIILNMKR